MKIYSWNDTTSFHLPYWLFHWKTYKAVYLLGPQGRTGNPGKPGPKGKAGAIGKAGPRGPKGLKGNPGKNGAPGKKGPKGSKGETGLPGPCTCNANKAKSAFSVAVSKSYPRERLPIKFDRILMNEGGHYNASSGKFVCSIPGIYYFTYDITLANKHLAIGLVHNGQYRIKTFDANTGNHDVASGSTILSLKQEDEVWLQIFYSEQNGLFYDPYWTDSLFTGFLIYPDQDYLNEIWETNLWEKIGNAWDLSPAKCSLYMDMSGISIQFHIFGASSLYGLFRYSLNVINWPTGYQDQQDSPFSSLMNLSVSKTPNVFSQISVSMYQHWSPASSYSATCHGHVTHILVLNVLL